MKEEKNIDKLFKHGLEDPVDETAFREGDWDAFEQLLDKDKRRGKVLWLPILSSVAAILIAVFGWWMFRPQVTKNNAQIAQQQTKVTQEQKLQPIITDRAQKAGEQVATLHKPETNSAHETGKLFTQPRPNKAQDQQHVNSVVIDTREITNIPANTVAVTPTVSGQSSIYNMRDDEPLTAHGLASEITPISSNNTPVIASVNILPEATDADATAAPKAIIKKSGGSSFRPQFALTVLAASEKNGVGSLQNTNSGSNISLLFSVGVKKFTVSTGASYSLKPYTLPFDQYHTAYQFKNAPEYVSADCRVLDIPINIDYQVYKRAGNKISVGTGLSSYIMMHESYNYDYGSSGSATGPASYTVKNQGKYLFSIMNLAATYQRQINSKVGISLQPYLKVPLSNIGYSQAKVETFGVAVGLNWNINSLTKPK